MLLNIIENLSGSVAMVTTMIGLLPQVYKSFKTKSTSDISMLMLINYFVCSFSWTIYGIITNATFVTWSNVFSLIVAVISILQKKHYDQNSERN